MGVGHNVEEQGRQCKIDDETVQLRYRMRPENFQPEGTPAGENQRENGKDDE